MSTFITNTGRIVSNCKQYHLSQ